jgi:ABC-type amino acid transport substrate-binding protein
VVRKDILKEKIISFPNPILFNKAFIAFSKKMKLKKLLEKFNKTLKAMRKDGSYKTVIDSFIVK